MTLDLQAYFDRIHYANIPQPDLPTLKQLHRQHLLHVPFENLDIHLQVPIQLEPVHLFDKVVRRRRGGFCYEQNGLLAVILKQIGFPVTLLEARVRNGEGGFGQPFDHLALRVDLDEPWLVDVGFGSSFLEPLQMRRSDIQTQGDKSYRVLLNTNDEGGEYQQLAPDGTILSGYQFSHQAYTLSDFEAACHYQQTSPESHFTRGKFCSITQADGRISLTQDKLIITQGETRHESPIADEPAFYTALQAHFGIVL